MSFPPLSPEETTREKAFALASFIGVNLLRMGYTIGEMDAISLAEEIINLTTDKGAPDLVAEVERLKSLVAELESDAKFAEALRSAGVDNWDGYSYAQELLREWGDDAS